MANIIGLFDYYQSLANSKIIFKEDMLFDDELSPDGFYEYNISPDDFYEEYNISPDDFYEEYNILPDDLNVIADLLGHGLISDAGEVSKTHN